MFNGSGVVTDDDDNDLGTLLDDDDVTGVVCLAVRGIQTLSTVCLLVEPSCLVVDPRALLFRARSLL